MNDFITKNKNKLIVAVVLLMLGGILSSGVIGTDGVSLQKDIPELDFNEQKNFGVLLSKVRSVKHSKNIHDRLQEMEVANTVVAIHNTEDDGYWYQIIVGSSDSFDEAVQIREQLENDHAFEDLTIINFDDIAHLVSAAAKNVSVEVEKIDADEPDIPSVAFETIKEFPFTNFFFVQRLTLYTSPKFGEKSHHSLMKKVVSNDLPRGISRSSLLKQTQAFAEAVFVDNIYDDSVTINVLKMHPRTDLDIEGDLLNYFAQKILDTGRYRTELVEDFAIATKSGWRGVKVTIEPKSNYFRKYILIQDTESDWVYFSQSTKKTDEDMKKILTEIGSSDGLLQYDEFYNTFYTLPSNLSAEDEFQGFDMSRIRSSYAKGKGYRLWAKRCVGHWRSTGFFYHDEKGPWSYGLFDLLSKENVDKTYNLYVNDGYSKTKIDVFGSTGRYVLEDRWSKRKYKTYKWPLEINFPQQRYLCMINNASDRGYLKKDMLLERANSLQLQSRGGYHSAP